MEIILLSDGFIVNLGDKTINGNQFIFIHYEYSMTMSLVPLHRVSNETVWLSLVDQHKVVELSSKPTYQELCNKVRDSYKEQSKLLVS